METNFILESSLNSQKELFDYLELLLDEIAHLTGYKLIGGKNSILKRVSSCALWKKTVNRSNKAPKIFKSFGFWFLYETESNLGFRLDNKLYQKIFKSNEILGLLVKSKNYRKLLYLLSEWNKIGKDSPDRYNDLINFVSVNISGGCNLSCKYCFNKGGSYNRQIGLNLSSELARKIIEFIRIKDGFSSTVEIKYFGGEPLLNIKSMMAMVDACKNSHIKSSRKIHFSLITNGTLINNSALDFIRNYISILQISFVPMKKLHDYDRPQTNGKGSFDEIVKNIKKIPLSLKKRTSLATVFNSTELNFDEIDAFCQEFEIKRLMLGIVRGVGYKKNLLDSFLHKIQKYYLKRINNFRKSNLKISTIPEESFSIPFGMPISLNCSAGSKMIAVDSEGNLSGCYLFLKSSNFFIGNIKDHNINMSNLHNTTYLVDPQYSAICKMCWAKNVCGGDCGFERHFGQFDHTNYCDHLKQLNKIKIALASLCSDEDKNYIRQISSENNKPLC